MNSKISIIIPVKDLSYYLTFENLPALEKQTYRHFEVIVVTNHHTQYDLTLLKKYPWLIIIPSGKITKPAEKRNLGVAKATGDIIACIDDDAYPQDKWLKNAVRLFKDHPSISAVCGPGILPSNAKFWERVGDTILHTWLGAGDYRYRFSKKKSRFVDDYPSMNFFIRTDMFKKLGGFKGAYWPGEDSKLCNDLVYKEKGKILYDPSVLIYHHRRNNLGSYLRQHANYGYHRGAFFAQGDMNSKRLSYLIPTFFVFYFTLSVIYGLLLITFSQNSWRYSFFFLPLIIYVLGSIYTGIKSLVQTKNILIALVVPLVLFLTHIVYGILFIKGFYKKDHIYD